MKLLNLMMVLATVVAAQSTMAMTSPKDETRQVILPCGKITSARLDDSTAAQATSSKPVAQQVTVKAGTDSVKTKR